MSSPTTTGDGPRRAIAAYLPQFLLELRGLDLAAELVSVEGSDGAGIVMACTAAAGRRAVRPGMTVAQAVQGCPTLQGVRHNGNEEARALLALQEKLDGLWPAANVRAISGPFLVLDAPTGGALSAVACSPEREQAQAHELVRVLRRLGHAAHAAVAASGPAAMALAQGAWSGQDGDVVVVPLGHTALALAPLPVRALPGIAPELVAALAARGVRTCGALAALPLASVQAALGPLAPVGALYWRVARSEEQGGPLLVTPRGAPAKPAKPVEAVDLGVEVEPAPAYPNLINLAERRRLRGA